MCGPNPFSVVSTAVDSLRKQLINAVASTAVELLLKQLTNACYFNCGRFDGWSSCVSAAVETMHGPNPFLVESTVVETIRRPNPFLVESTAVGETTDETSVELGACIAATANQVGLQYVQLKNCLQGCESVGEHVSLVLKHPTKHH